jgi:2,4-dienoyl-CoA reductase-like NADH-dependent reductase (Old Yellow Enzyme family)
MLQRPMPSLFDPLTFARGPAMKNRFMLAPLTNSQSHPDGRLSEEEFRWLTMRARGGFGLTMTCASHVQAQGQGFGGQLGIWSDIHLEGLSRLAAAIKGHGSLAVAQLHHAGMRSPADLIGQAPVAPSDDEKTGARALTESEIETLIEDFIGAAHRAELAGFDGAEIHGAHGYILAQFLSAESNRRADRFGGSPENRARILFDIIDGVRARCRSDFHLGVRLSPERFGLKLAEIVAVARRLMSEGNIDQLDMSLWDFAKEPNEEEYKGATLMSYFTGLDRGRVRLCAAGKIMTGKDAAACLDAGLDFVVIGRAAILHHDFPERVRADARFEPIGLPVSVDYLGREGLSPVFVDYMRRWPNFVEEQV